MSQIRTHGRALEPTIQEVGPGIHAYLQLDGSWGLNNAGILPGSRGVTLIDTTFTAARAHALSEAVQAVAAVPVRTVINTHHHGDHTYGNFVFPDATIIGHERCRQTMLATGLETTKYFPGVEWGDIEILPPFVTFEDRLTVYVDDQRLELLAMGVAHTTNDIIVWVPEHQLCFSGDLVFNGGTPFVVMGSVAGALEALARLRELAPAVVVPGHGAVCGPEAIDDQIEYLEFIQRLAAAAQASGTPPLAAARDTDLGRFGEWTDAERIVGNLHRAMAEQRGEPRGVLLDFDRIVEDMVAFNDGRPLRCLA